MTRHETSLPREEQDNVAVAEELNKIAGEQGLFIKRSPQSGGALDAGWKVGGVIGEGESRKVIVGKRIGDQDGTRTFTFAELARLNYGRSRKALEHFFREKVDGKRTGRSTDDIESLTVMVDRADPPAGQEPDADAKLQLSFYFEQKALHSWKQLYPKSRAKSLDEMVDEVTEHQDEPREAIEEGVRHAEQGLAAIAEEKAGTRNIEQLRELDDQLEEARSLQGRMRAEGRAVERGIANIISYIDLAQQYSEEKVASR